MDRPETSTEIRMDLRPLDLPALLDRSVELYRQNFLLFAAMMGVVYVPFGLVTMAAAMINQAAHLVATWLGVLIILPLWPLQLGAMIHAAAWLYLGRPARFRDSWRAAFARTLPLLITALLVGILVTFGFVMLVIPGLVLVVLTTFALHVVMLEDTGYDRAIVRSFQLCRYDWPRIAVLYVAMWLLQNVLVAAPSMLLLFVIRDPDTMAAVNSAWGALSGAVVIPLYTLPYVMLYFDIRIRREGMDLRLMADQLGPLPPPAASQEPRPPGGAPASCSACRAALVPEASFCNACGAAVAGEGPLPAPPGRCPSCGRPLLAEAGFCTFCGAAAGPVPAAPAARAVTPSWHAADPPPGEGWS